MIRKKEFIYLLFILSLNYSCIANNSSGLETRTSELVKNKQIDTLKFTSGIRAIFNDSKGNYWFGSHNEGLCLYDGKTFKYFTTKDGLQDNQIRSIQEDERGRIWIATAKGVNSYFKGRFKAYSTDLNAPESDWNSTTGNLWFHAGEEDGINRFNGTKMNYLVFPKPQVISPFKSFGVTGITKDKKGRVWIATYSALFNYDGEKVDVYGPEKLKIEDDKQIHIRSVLVDSKERIWIGNNGIGVILINGDSTIHFSKEEGKLLPIKEFESNIRGGQTAKNTGLQSVFAIEEDAAGNIWFGDRDSGAWKYDGKCLTNYTICNNGSNPMIWTIYKDNSNNLLFGLADGKIYKFHENSFIRMF